MIHYLQKLKEDLHTIICTAKPLHGIGTLKDRVHPFDKSGIDPKDVVILNHRDPDGFLSAIIINQYLGGGEMIDVQYGEPLDIDYLKGKVVFVVDFSFPPKIMKQIQDTAAKFIWTDHHASSLKDMKEARDKKEIGAIEGLQCVGPSGCDLAWLQMYGTIENIPPVVALAGAYDTARYNSNDPEMIIKKDMEFQNKVIMPSQLALRTNYSDQHDAALQLLVESGDGSGSVIDDLIAQGQAMWKYVRKSANDSVRTNGFLLELEGVKFVAMFNNRRSSHEFGDAVAKTEAEAMLVIMPMDNGAIMSFYCDDDLDMSKVAKTFGGGGHKGAAGAQVSKEVVAKLWSKAKPLTFSDV